MKQILTLVMLLAVSIGVQAQVDDMYFVPKKKKVQKVEESSSYEFETTQQRVSLPAERDADEYNRRPGAGNSGYNDEDTEYDNEEYNESVAEDVDDTEFCYSSRIVRFHSPHRVIVSSPWYWDVVYTSGIDNWVICDDGIYWELYPMYDPWFQSSWSWAYGWPYYSPYWNHYGCWSGWHASHYWWHHHHHHYNYFHPHWGGHYNNHFAGGRHFRDGRIPPIADLRTGNTIARGTNIERNNGLRRGEMSGSIAQSNNRGSIGSQNRGTNRNGTTIDRGTVSRRGEVNGRTNNRGVVNKERQSRTNNRSTVNSSERRSNNRGTVRQNSERERNYDRPSSTRNTSRSSSVERSSSGSNRSFSGGGGFSRSSGGGVSRGGGGGSRGGGRR